MNDLARQALCGVLAQYGHTIYLDIPRCEALLLDRCASYKKERSALIAALRERIPEELVGSQNSQPYPSLAARLARRLEDHLGLDATVAQWAVESWAIALGVRPQAFAPPTSIEPPAFTPPTSIEPPTPPTSIEPPTLQNTVLDAYRREDVFQTPIKPDFVGQNRAMPPAAQSHYAGFWQRFAAAFIDGLILLIPILIIFVLAVAASSSDPTLTARERSSSAIWTTQIIGGIVGWLYFATLESSPAQATYGKRAVGLKVVDRNGNRIGFGRATGRYLSKTLSSFFYIGYIMAAFTERKQALHDLIASTFVVNTQP